MATGSAALSDAEIAALITSAGWTGEDAYTGFGIVIAESGGRPDAVNRANSNGTHDDGLWQINSIHKDLLKTGNVYNAADNTRMARSIYTAAGNKWTPWSTYNNQRYRIYRARAVAAFGSSAGTTDGGMAGKYKSFDATSSSLIPTDGATWARMGQFLAGAALLIVFALSIVGTKNLANLVPMGRALNAVKAAT